MQLSMGWFPALKALVERAEQHLCVMFVTESSLTYFYELWTYRWFVMESVELYPSICIELLSLLLESHWAPQNEPLET